MNDFITLITSNPDQSVLLGGFLVCMLVLVYWHASTKNSIDIRDLMVDSESGKLNLYKIGQLFALLVSTWILIHETRLGRLTEFLFIGYMTVWSGATALNKYITQKKEADPTADK